MRFLTALLIIVCLIFACGCSEEKNTDKKNKDFNKVDKNEIINVDEEDVEEEVYENPNDDKLVALIDVSSSYVVLKDGRYIASYYADVPDFKTLFENHHEEAEAQASDSSEYERILYELVYNDPMIKEVEEESYKLDLYLIDPEKSDWTEEELVEIQRQYAFDEAMESFAIEQIQKNETYFEGVDLK